MSIPGHSEEVSPETSYKGNMRFFKVKSAVFALICKVTLGRIAPGSESFSCDLIEYICIAKE